MKTYKVYVNTCWCSYYDADDSTVHDQSIFMEQELMIDGETDPNASNSCVADFGHFWSSEHASCTKRLARYDFLLGFCGHLTIPRY